MSRVVSVGKVNVGGKNPVRIKGMIKTPYSDRKRVAREVFGLEKQGAEIIRVAIKEEKDLDILSIVKKKTGLPLVADIHFNPRLAILAAEAGFEGIRLNPLNIRKRNDIRKIAASAKRNKISIRVGVNSGGFKRASASPKVFAGRMVREALRYIDCLEKEGFFDIMVSLKGAGVASTVEANRMLAKQTKYPIHLGVTATGPFAAGLVKSSIGLGILLNEGIGDAVRVSLTAPSYKEITAAKDILSALRLRRFGPEIISCPTCSRCEVDLLRIAARFQKEVDNLSLKRPLKIALMGCVVNGPGEARQADIGAAFGRKKAVIFRKNTVLGQSSETKIIKDLKREINKLWT